MTNLLTFYRLKVAQRQTVRYSFPLLPVKSYPHPTPVSGVKLVRHARRFSCTFVWSIVIMYFSFSVKHYERKQKTKSGLRGIILPISLHYLQFTISLDNTVLSRILRQCKGFQFKDLYNDDFKSCFIFLMYTINITLKEVQDNNFPRQKNAIEINDNKSKINKD